ncbi:unnamed protein product, partial [Ixodes pacificus]
SNRKNNGAGTQFSGRDRNNGSGTRGVSGSTPGTRAAVSAAPLDIRAPSGSDAAGGPGAPPGSGGDPCPRAGDVASPGTGCRRGPTAGNGRDPATSEAGPRPEVFGAERPDC